MLVNFSKPPFLTYNGAIIVDVLPILVLDNEHKVLI